MPNGIPKLDPDQIARLAEVAGIEADPKLLGDIEDIAAEYEARKGGDPIRLAEIRKRLAASKNSLDTALQELMVAGARAHSQLRGVYRQKFLRLERDTKVVQRLSGTIDELLNQLPKSGRPSKEPRDRLFVELAKLYEQRSGRAFKYPDKREGFLGSNFVRGLAKVIEPEFTDRDYQRGLTTAREILGFERTLEKSKQ